MPGAARDPLGPLSVLTARWRWARSAGAARVGWEPRGGSILRPHCRWLRAGLGPLTALLLLCAPHGAMAEEALETLGDLVRAERYEEAYAHAREARAALEGSLHFDFLYARAAIETGRIGEGILALERVLRRDPGFERARLELARARFLEGDDRRAAREFRAVLASDPPSGVAATVDRYLAALDRRADRYRPTLTGHAELGLGYDSNVNSATDADTVATGLGPIELVIDPSGRETGDGLLHYGAAVDGSVPLAPGWKLVAGVDAAGRELRDEDGFETAAVEAYGGAAWRSEAGRLRASARFRRFYVGGDRYRSRYGLDLGWRRRLAGPWVASLGASWSRLRYRELELLDSDLALLRAGVARSFEVEWRPTAAVGVYGGAEWAEGGSDAARAVAERTLAGVRGRLELRPAPAWRLVASAQYRASRYAEEEALFAREREEDLVEAGLRLDWEPSPHWRIGPGVRYRHNDANIGVYDYDRTLVDVRARYAFF